MHTNENLAYGLLNILSEDDVLRIHDASILLLEEHGIKCKSNLIFDAYKKGGANVNLNTGVIMPSSDMVQSALALAPKSFVFYGRDPSRDLLIEPGRFYFGMGGSPEPFYYDYNLNKPRESTKVDVAYNTRIGQNTEEINIILNLCMAGDCPQPESYLHEYDAILRNTDKPVIFSAPSRWYTQKFIEMAIAASGGEEVFNKRPCVALYYTGLDPMEVNEYCDGIIDAALAGVPILVSAGAMMGSTCPVSISGSLVQMNAEALFGIVLAQLVKPGAPVIYGPHANPMDMITGQTTYGRPEGALYRAGIAQLGRYYNLPTLGLGGGVDSKTPDAEAATQAMMCMLLNVLSGLTITITLGTMASGLYGSSEMLMICCENIRMIKRIIAGIKVTEKRMAVDVIKNVNHGGEFVTHNHTMQYFRDELSIPNLFKQQVIDDWIKNGSKFAHNVAHECVEEILAKAGPITLPQGADLAMEETLQNALDDIK